MALNDSEVEIKIPVDEKEFLRVRDQLKETAVFRGQTKQTDEYFMPIHRNFLSPKYPFEWLSIRKRGKCLLNYKYFHPENSEVHTHCDEFETEVSDMDKLRKIFDALNIESIVTVEKERELYSHGDFEIALDTVKDLGRFIEIEAAADFGSIEAARKKIIEIAKTLGLDVSKKDERGYPYRLLEKKRLATK